MSLFEAHTGANESNAKEALVNVLSRTVGKYVIAQSMLNGLLTSSSSKGCNLCKIDELTKQMAKLQQQTGEIVKSYEMLFNEEAPLKKITKEAVKQFYPLLLETKGKRMNWGAPSKSTSTSSNTPSSSSSSSFNSKEDSIKSAIVKAIAKATGTDEADIHINGGLIDREALTSINPGSYDSFEEYLEAVKSISSPFSDDTKSGEELLTELATKHAEAQAKAPTTPSRNGSVKSKKTDA